MKRVVIKKETDTIDIELVGIFDFIGILSKDGRKLMPVDNGHGEYIAVSINSISDNSNLRIYDSLESFLRAFVVDPWDVLVFDSRKELKEWLLKD